MSLQQLRIDKSWSLFLDRDGVINHRIVGGYVTKWEEFRFNPGVPEALNSLSCIFGRIIVVSNQQGVGKGIMDHEDVLQIHGKMTDSIRSAGGRIDAVLYCGALESERSINRKPNIGMGLQARKLYPEIRFKKSVMVGDSLSDMIFGKRLGMKTVLLSATLIQVKKGFRMINYALPDLPAFAKEIAVHH
jgi:histidinol-phosphate phosphatase family protein